MADPNSTVKSEIAARIAAKKLIVVAGAGVTIASVDAASKAKAGWIGLLKDGLDAIATYNAGEATDIDIWRKLIDTKTTDNLIAVAERITRGLRGPIGGDFRNWLERSVGSLSIADPTLIDAIAALDAPILTTNYDDLLSKSTNRKFVTAKHAHDIETWLKDRIQSILHLHGHYKEPESVVLGLRSYDEILGNDIAQVLMRSTALEFSLLFVGCGAGLEDPNFGALLEWMRKNLPTTRSHHYRLCRDGELLELQKLHPIEQRVLPLSYGKEPGDLAHWLHDLRSRASNAKPKGKQNRPKLGSKTTAADDSQFDRYREFVRERTKRVSMRALQAGEFDFDFDRIYVPLQAVAFPHERDPDLAKHGFRRDDYDCAVEARSDLEGVFASLAKKEPHLLILGDPGSGKTTALKKLAHLVLTGKIDTLRLDDTVLPVTLRLRMIRAEDLSKPLVEFLDRELSETSDHKLETGLGAKLFERGNLLLLLDGLDEIGDEKLRARCCRYLDKQLKAIEAKNIRAVVSCRRLGYRGDVKFSTRFARAEVQPLGPDHVDDLVTRWFDEVARNESPEKRGETEKQRDDLILSLRKPPFNSQSYKLLVGNPLLLTILCIVVHRGHSMPKRRAHFFDLCLKTLVNRGHVEGTDRPLLDATETEALLRGIAWSQHHAKRRDDITWGGLLKHIQTQLASLAHPEGHSASRVLDWLHQRASILDEFAPKQYGFFHLGLQEFLSAKELAVNVDKKKIRKLASSMWDSWWREVGLMFCGVSGADARNMLLKDLLKRRGVTRNYELIRECLEEAESPDLSEVIAALEQSKDEVEQRKLLELLMYRRDRAMLEVVRRIASDAKTHEHVRTAARRVLEAAQRPDAASEREFALLLFRDEDSTAAAEIGKALRGAGTRVLGEPGPPPSYLALDGAEIENRLRMLAWVVADAAKPPWLVPDLADLADFLESSSPVATVAIRAPGVRKPRLLPHGLTAERVFEIGRVAEIDLALGKVQATPRQGPRRGATKKSWDDVFVEPLTGIRFLRVPRGKFRMGRDEGERFESPAHDEIVDHDFWLAETPITNQQFAVFLSRTGESEPVRWRDKRFSAPDQPVVTVTHGQAQHFCRWLSEELRGEGLAIRLPSEIEWEYAARGPKSLKYAWGNEPEPNAELACFGLNWNNPNHRPAAVGSFVEGKGPFGHLDLAGLVWEWCEDVWSEDIYERRATGARIEVNEQGDPDIRVLRGGSWRNSARYLAAAVRLRSHATFRYDGFGFRVVSVPASTGPSSA